METINKSTVDAILYGCAAFALLIGVVAFIGMVLAASGYEHEIDPVDIPGDCASLN